MAQRSVGPDALLKQKDKQKRFREGYAEGISTLFKQTSAASFIASESPVDMLGQFTRYSHDAKYRRVLVVEYRTNLLSLTLLPSISFHALATPDPHLRLSAFGQGLFAIRNGWETLGSEPIM